MTTRRSRLATEQSLRRLVRCLLARSVCAYAATIGDPNPGGGPGGGSDNGEISVTGRSGDVNGVFVETYLNSTTPSDRPFYVVVFC
jgi:hypothetical protein